MPDFKLLIHCNTRAIFILFFLNIEQLNVQ